MDVGPGSSSLEDNFATLLASMVNDSKDKDVGSGASSSTPVLSSFVEDALRNENARREVWNNVWAQFAFCYKAYLDSLQVLSDEHHMLYERNIGSGVAGAAMN